METAMYIFCGIGALMFVAYVVAIIKTSRDDDKIRKQEKLNSNGKA